MRCLLDTKKDMNTLSMPETSWLRPVFAVELPADHKDLILPRTTLGQCRLSFDVADAVIEAKRKSLFSKTCTSLSSLTEQACSRFATELPGTWNSTDKHSAVPSQPYSY